MSPTRMPTKGDAMRPPTTAVPKTPKESRYAKTAHPHPERADARKYRAPSSSLPLDIGLNPRRLMLDRVVERVALDGDEARVLDERDDLLSGHLDLVPGLDRVARGEFAALGDGPVEVVRAVVQGDLREPLAEHHPVGLDVREVVEHEARDGHRLEGVHARRPRQVRELRARRVEGERDEALEAARAVLLLAQTDEVVDAVLRRLDVAVEHRRVGLEARGVDFARKLQPAPAVGLVRADHRARRLAENLGPAARTRVHPRLLQTPDDLLVRHLVEAREVVYLDHRPRLEVEAGELPLERREEVGEVAERQFRVQAADDVELGRALFDGLARDAQGVFDVVRVGVRLPGR